MEIKKLEGIIEAILFTIGEAVEVDKIADAIQHDKETTRKLIYNMMDKYNEEDRGIQIVEIVNSFQMCTKADTYEYIRNIVKAPKKHNLTESLLETLSIIAYKQPITKIEIENIRGVRSDHAVSKLVEYNLVTDIGRLPAPGRPLLFGTTDEFLRHFGLTSIGDLPELPLDQMETFQIEAEEEAQLTLNVEPDGEM